MAPPQRTVIAVVLLALALATRGEEPVAVAHLKWETGAAKGVAGRKLSPEEVPAEGLQVPAKVGDETRYGSIAIGANRVVHYAFDGKTVWLDQNLDLGTLTPAGHRFVAVSITPPPRAEFGRITIRVRRESTQEEVPVEFHLATNARTLACGEYSA